MMISPTINTTVSGATFAPQATVESLSEVASVTNSSEQLVARGNSEPGGSEASADDRESASNTPTQGEEPDSVQGLTPEERQEVRELAARDREVRAHEQAHASVGGQYAGAPSYTYQRGPDGRQYAVGGEVSIDVSPVPGDPQATIDKARIVRRAALAPAEPSAQDRSVAAEATALEQQARAELLAEAAENTERSRSAGEGESTTLFYVPIDVTA